MGRRRRVGAARFAWLAPAWLERRRRPHARQAAEQAGDHLHARRGRSRARHAAAAPTSIGRWAPSRWRARWATRRCTRRRSRQRWWPVRGTVRWRRRARRRGPPCRRAARTRRVRRSATMRGGARRRRRAAVARRRRGRAAVGLASAAARVGELRRRRERREHALPLARHEPRRLRPARRARDRQRKQRDGERSILAFNGVANRTTVRGVVRVGAAALPPAAGFPASADGTQIFAARPAAAPASRPRRLPRRRWSSTDGASRGVRFPSLHWSEGDGRWHGPVAQTMENHPMGVGIPGGEIPLEIDGFGDTAAPASPPSTCRQDVGVRLPATRASAARASSTACARRCSSPLAQRAASPRRTSSLDGDRRLRSGTRASRRRSCFLDWTAPFIGAAYARDAVGDRPSLDRRDPLAGGASDVDIEDVEVRWTRWPHCSASSRSARSTTRAARRTSSPPTPPRRARRRASRHRGASSATGSMTRPRGATASAASAARPVATSGRRPGAPTCCPPTARWRHRLQEPRLPARHHARGHADVRVLGRRQRLVRGAVRRPAPRDRRRLLPRSLCDQPGGPRVGASTDSCMTVDPSPPTWPDPPTLVRQAGGSLAVAWPAPVEPPPRARARSSGGSAPLTAARTTRRSRPARRVRRCRRSCTRTSPAPCGRRCARPTARGWPRRRRRPTRCSSAAPARRRRAPPRDPEWGRHPGGEVGHRARGASSAASPAPPRASARFEWCVGTRAGADDVRSCASSHVPPRLVLADYTDEIAPPPPRTSARTACSPPPPSGPRAGGAVAAEALERLRRRGARRSTGQQSVGRAGAGYRPARRRAGGVVDTTEPRAGRAPTASCARRRRRAVGGRRARHLARGARRRRSWRPTSGGGRLAQLDALAERCRRRTT